jgi:hypothetical protein
VKSKTTPILLTSRQLLFLLFIIDRNVKRWFAQAQVSNSAWKSGAALAGVS